MVRMPNTPVAFPFTQHTMPVFGGKSWSDIVHWPYKRLRNGKVKNNDAIVLIFQQEIRLFWRNRQRVIEKYGELPVNCSKEIRTEIVSKTGESY